MGRYLYYHSCIYFYSCCIFVNSIQLQKGNAYEIQQGEILIHTKRKTKQCEKRGKIARKCKSILYLSKIMLTAPQGHNFVFSSKIISNFGIQRAPENIFPDSYLHWSKRQFYNWIRVLGGVTVYLFESILKGLATEWDRISHVTLHTTKYAAYEFSMPFLWQHNFSLALTCKDRQKRTS